MRAGFVISSSKTDKPEDNSQVKSYLGFIINTVEMKIYASDEKIKKVKEALQAVLDLDGRPCPSKQVASVVGKIIALELAYGPVVQLLTRCAQRDLSIQVEKAGWSSLTSLSEEALIGLQEFLLCLNSMNGSVIQSIHNAISLSNLLHIYDTPRTIS